MPKTASRILRAGKMSTSVGILSNTQFGSIQTDSHPILSAINSYHIDRQKKCQSTL